LYTPKTGPDGSTNLTSDSIAYLYKKVLLCIQQNELYEVVALEGKIEFIKK
jgi:hypothetical protein